MIDFGVPPPGGTLCDYIAHLVPAWAQAGKLSWNEYALYSVWISS